MKKFILSGLIFFALSIGVFTTLNAQKNEWVNQVIVVNGGKFESGTPTDYVTVQSYNPATGMTNVFGTIFTQSTQHAVIKDKYLFVAAQDSIVKYDLDSYKRLAAVADSGLSKLFIYNDRLIVTKQWPIKRFFAEVLDMADLSLITRIQNISGDCGEVAEALDTIYIAVNGGYAGTEGKLAVINPNNWSLVREVNMGQNARGIRSLYNFNGIIRGICRTPAGSVGTGYIALYDFYTTIWTTFKYNVTLGEGFGLKNNLLYASVNNGIGVFDMLTNQIVDTTLVPDPGSLFKINFSSAAVDYVGGKIYANIGNMITFGRGVIYNPSGDSIGSYPTGLNADAIAIDYRVPVGIDQPSDILNVALFPNPVSEMLFVSLPAGGQINGIIVSDVSGRTTASSYDFSQGVARFDCSKLSPGIYFITVRTSAGNVTRKFIKQ
jgi:hypothetical protein